MKQECSNKCIKALESIKSTTLYQAIQDFVNNIDAMQKEPRSLQDFYSYILMRYGIPCEAGMLFVEKLVMVDIFEKYCYNHDSNSDLINEKLILYNWILPKHLEIICKLPESLCKSFKKIESTNVPTVKISYLMLGVQAIYKIIGPTSGQDIFFPCLVYYLLKARIKNINLHIIFMKTFKRQFVKACEPGCMHGFSMEICCDCIKYHDWKGEDDYYLANAEAAIEFIRKLEFYNLKIALPDFEKEITKGIERMSILKKSSEFDNFFKE